MIKQFTHNLPLFNTDEHDAVNGHHILYLNRHLLLGEIQNLKSLASIWDMRTAVAAIKRRIEDANDEIHTHTGETSVIKFHRDHILSDLEQISESLTVERARYYIDRLIKSINEEKIGKDNDINLNRWKEYEDIYTDSLWIIDRRDSSGVHSADYWGNFIPQIPYQMMRRYTKMGDWVLDTFSGSGTTLIEGQRLGRNCIGIEIQKRMVDYSRHLVTAEPNPHNVTIDIVEGDSTSVNYPSVLERHGIKSVQLIIMHPPYFDIIKFSESKRDLSNARSVEEFLEMLGLVVENSSKVLDKNRYLILVIGDKYAKGEWIPLGFYAMNEVLKRGFSLKSIVVKNFEDTSAKRHQKELWRYRALAGGFYVFKHEYIFIFRRM
jgi:16S rRNA G966 N2-methylase RsmD